MKTAGLIKLSSASNAKSLVDYDTQTRKTSGDWRGRDYGYRQSDLVTFHGVPNVDGSVHDKVNAFVRDANDNANVHLVTDVNNRVTNEVMTVIQSYDYRANPKLKPDEVHIMGGQLYSRMQTYLKNEYNYDLEDGAVSTHIDDDIDRAIDGKTRYKIRKPHLHNHIAIPYFNSNGEAIYPYMRKHDIYALQHINDGITREHNLNDYYFAQLERYRQPMSSYTLRRQKRDPKRRSNLGTAWFKFKEANDWAWDYAKGDYPKAKELRDDYLHYKYGYKVKDKTDKQTGKKHQVFTLKGLSTNGRQQWYNLVNMQALRWRDKKEARAERLLWEFDFKKLKSKAVSFDDYKNTIKYAGRHLPEVESIVTPELRDRFKIGLYGCYKKARSAYHDTAKKFRDNVTTPLSRKFSDGMAKVRQLEYGYASRILGKRHKTHANDDTVISRVPALAEQGRKQERTVRAKREFEQSRHSQSTERVHARPTARRTKRERNGIDLE